MENSCSRMIYCVVIQFYVEEEETIHEETIYMSLSKEKANMFFDTCETCDVVDEMCRQKDLISKHLVAVEPDTPFSEGIVNEKCIRVEIKQN